MPCPREAQGARLLTLMPALPPLEQEQQQEQGAAEGQREGAGAEGIAGGAATTSSTTTTTTSSSSRAVLQSMHRAREGVRCCDSAGPLVVFVSKMVPVR